MDPDNTILCLSNKGLNNKISPFGIEPAFVPKVETGRLRVKGYHAKNRFELPVFQYSLTVISELKVG